MKSLQDTEIRHAKQDIYCVHYCEKVVAPRIRPGCYVTENKHKQGQRLCFRLYLDTGRPPFVSIR